MSKVCYENDDNNLIRRLENLPDSLREMYDNNQIRRLENLPDSLREMYDNNQIRRLENLPDSLRELDIDDWEKKFGGVKEERYENDDNGEINRHFFLTTSEGEIDDDPYEVGQYDSFS